MKWNFRRSSDDDQQPDPNQDAIRTKKRSHIARLNIVYGLVFLAFGSLVVRLGYLQIVDGSKYRNQAMTTTVQPSEVLPARGRIFDANGNLLAEDSPEYDLYYTRLQHLSKTEVKNSELKVANLLAPVFHKTPKAVLTLIKTNEQYAQVRLFKNISLAQMSFVESHLSQMPGITVQESYVRTYPYGDLAGHVLGYVGPIQNTQVNTYIHQLGYQRDQIVGQSGIEEEYESKLQGKVGYDLLQINMQGTSSQDLGLDPAPTPGDNIQLTLDGRLQAEAQNDVIKKVLSSENASQISDAAAVAVDVKNGGVLAMVSYPYVDPDWYTESGELSKHSSYLSTPGVQSNNVIQNPNYPGSTIKPSTLIAGLTYGGITSSQIVDAEGHIYVSTQRMNDDQAFGPIGPIQAIAKSSEVFFYEVGLYLGHWFGASYSNGGGTGGISFSTWERKYFIKGLMAMYHTEWEFGLGPKTGIDLPNEMTGKFYDQDASEIGAPAKRLYNISNIWNTLLKKGSYDTNHTETPTTLAQAATGQMQQFTPMQLATYVSTIANNGKKIQPHLLKAVYSPGMQTKLTSKDKPIQVVKAKTTKLPFKQSYIHLAQEGMEGVTQSGGTAASAFVSAPYEAAGKTGTAQIYIKGTQVDNSVFIAYAPANNPQIAVAVMVPGAGYGAITAAPIARDMMDTYFKEHHEFFPKKDWTSTKIPSNWKSSTAYTEPENAK